MEVDVWLSINDSNQSTCLLTKIALSAFEWNTSVGFIWLDIGWFIVKWALGSFRLKLAIASMMKEWMHRLLAMSSKSKKEINISLHTMSHVLCAQWQIHHQVLGMGWMSDPGYPMWRGGSQGGTASGMVPIHHTANDFEIVITAHKQDTLPHVLVCVLMEVIDPVICTQ